MVVVKTSKIMEKMTIWRRACLLFAHLRVVKKHERAWADSREHGDEHSSYRESRTVCALRKESSRVWDSKNYFSRLFNCFATRDDRTISVFTIYPQSQSRATTINIVLHSAYPFECFYDGLFAPIVIILFVNAFSHRIPHATHGSFHK